MKILSIKVAVRRDLERNENLVAQGRPGRERHDNILNVMGSVLIYVCCDRHGELRPCNSPITMCGGHCGHPSATVHD